MATRGEPTVIDPLPLVRLSAPFERLRDAGDEYLRSEGRRPAVFLASLGTAAQYSARTTFAKNLFEVGGVEGLGARGYSTADECVADFEASGAEIAVLCSADSVYEELVETVAPALKAAGAQRLYLAGRPDGQAERYEAAGVDEFVYSGVDVLDVLDRAHDCLGVS